MSGDSDVAPLRQESYNKVNRRQAPSKKGKALNGGLRADLQAFISQNLNASEETKHTPGNKTKLEEKINMPRISRSKSFREASKTGGYSTFKDFEVNTTPFFQIAPISAGDFNLAVNPDTWNDLQNSSLSDAIARLGIEAIPNPGTSKINISATINQCGFNADPDANTSSIGTVFNQEGLDLHTSATSINSRQKQRARSEPAGPKNAFKFSDSDPFDDDVSDGVKWQGSHKENSENNAHESIIQPINVFNDSDKSNVFRSTIESDKVSNIFQNSNQTQFSSEFVQKQKGKNKKTKVRGSEDLVEIQSVLTAGTETVLQTITSPKIFGGVLQNGDQNRCPTPEQSSFKLGDICNEKSRSPKSSRKSTEKGTDSGATPKSKSKKKREQEHSQTSSPPKQRASGGGEGSCRSPKKSENAQEKDQKKTSPPRGSGTEGVERKPSPLRNKPCEIKVSQPCTRRRVPVCCRPQFKGAFFKCFAQAVGCQLNCIANMNQQLPGFPGMQGLYTPDIGIDITFYPNKIEEFEICEDIEEPVRPRRFTRSSSKGHGTPAFYSNRRHSVEPTTGRRRAGPVVTNGGRQSSHGKRFTSERPLDTDIRKPVARNDRQRPSERKRSTIEREAVPSHSVSTSDEYQGFDSSQSTEPPGEQSLVDSRQSLIKSRKSDSDYRAVSQTDGQSGDDVTQHLETEAPFEKISRLEDTVPRTISNKNMGHDKLLHEAKGKLLSNVSNRNKSESPSRHLSEAPSRQSLKAQSRHLSEAPSRHVSEAPSRHVSEAPTTQSSKVPSRHLSEAPSRQSLKAPSRHLSEAPSSQSSKAPSRHLSEAPSNQSSKAPSKHLSEAPSRQSLKTPSRHLSEAPSRQSSKVPSRHLSEAPSRHSLQVSERRSQPGSRESVRQFVNQSKESLEESDRRQLLQYEPTQSDILSEKYSSTDRKHQEDISQSDVESLTNSRQSLNRERKQSEKKRSSVARSRERSQEYMSDDRDTDSSGSVANSRQSIKSETKQRKVKVGGSIKDDAESKELCSIGDIGQNLAITVKCEPGCKCQSPSSNCIQVCTSLGSPTNIVVLNMLDCKQVRSTVEQVDSADCDSLVTKNKDRSSLPRTCLSMRQTCDCDKCNDVYPSTQREVISDLSHSRDRCSTPNAAHVRQRYPDTSRSPLCVKRSFYQSASDISPSRHSNSHCGPLTPDPSFHSHYSYGRTHSGLMSGTCDMPGTNYQTRRMRQLSTGARRDDCRICQDVDQRELNISMSKSLETKDVVRSLTNDGDLMNLITRNLTEETSDYDTQNEKSARKFGHRNYEVLKRDSALSFDCGSDLKKSKTDGSSLSTISQDHRGEWCGKQVGQNHISTAIPKPSSSASSECSTVRLTVNSCTDDMARITGKQSRKISYNDDARATQSLIESPSTTKGYPSKCRDHSDSRQSHHDETFSKSLKGSFRHSSQQKEHSYTFSLDEPSSLRQSGSDRMYCSDQKQSARYRYGRKTYDCPNDDDGENRMSYEDDTTTMSHQRINSRQAKHLHRRSNSSIYSQSRHTERAIGGEEEYEKTASTKSLRERSHRNEDIHDRTEEKCHSDRVSFRPSPFKHECGVKNNCNSDTSSRLADNQQNHVLSYSSPNKGLKNLDVEIGSASSRSYSIASKDGLVHRRKSSHQKLHELSRQINERDSRKKRGRSRRQTLLNPEEQQSQSTSGANSSSDESHDDGDSENTLPASPGDLESEYNDDEIDKPKSRKHTQHKTLKSSVESDFQRLHGRVIARRSESQDESHNSSSCRSTPHDNNTRRAPSTKETEDISFRSDCDFKSPTQNHNYLTSQNEMTTALENPSSANSLHREHADDLNACKKHVALSGQGPQLLPDDKPDQNIESINPLQINCTRIRTRSPRFHIIRSNREQHGDGIGMVGQQRLYSSSRSRSNSASHDQREWTYREGTIDLFEQIITPEQPLQLHERRCMQSIKNGVPFFCRSLRTMIENPTKHQHSLFPSDSSVFVGAGSLLPSGDLCCIQERTVVETQTYTKTKRPSVPSEQASIVEHASVQKTRSSSTETNQCKRIGNLPCYNGEARVKNSSSGHKSRTRSTTGRSPSSLNSTQMPNLGFTEKKHALPFSENQKWDFQEKSLISDHEVEDIDISISNDVLALASNQNFSSNAERDRNSSSGNGDSCYPDYAYRCGVIDTLRLLDSDLVMSTPEAEIFHPRNQRETARGPCIGRHEMENHLSYIMKSIPSVTLGKHNDEAFEIIRQNSLKALLYAENVSGNWHSLDFDDQHAEKLDNLTQGYCSHSNTSSLGDIRLENCTDNKELKLTTKISQHNGQGNRNSKKAKYTISTRSPRVVKDAVENGQKRYSRAANERTNENVHMCYSSPNTEENRRESTAGKSESSRDTTDTSVETSVSITENSDSGSRQQTKSDSSPKATSLNRRTVGNIKQVKVNLHSQNCPRNKQNMMTSDRYGQPFLEVQARDYNTAHDKAGFSKTTLCKTKLHPQEEHRLRAAISIQLGSFQNFKLVPVSFAKQVESPDTGYHDKSSNSPLMKPRNTSRGVMYQRPSFQHGDSENIKSEDLTNIKSEDLTNIYGSLLQSPETGMTFYVLSLEKQHNTEEETGNTQFASKETVDCTCLSEETSRHKKYFIFTREELIRTVKESGSPSVGKWNNLGLFQRHQRQTRIEDKSENESGSAENALVNEREFKLTQLALKPEGETVRCHAVDFRTENKEVPKTAGKSDKYAKEGCHLFHDTKENEEGKDQIKEGFNSHQGIYLGGEELSAIKGDSHLLRETCLDGEKLRLRKRCCHLHQDTCLDVKEQQPKHTKGRCQLREDTCLDVKDQQPQQTKGRCHLREDACLDVKEQQPQQTKGRCRLQHEARVDRDEERQQKVHCHINRTTSPDGGNGRKTDERCHLRQDNCLEREDRTLKERCRLHLDTCSDGEDTYQNKGRCQIHHDAKSIQGEGPQKTKEIVVLPNGKTDQCLDGNDHYQIIDSRARGQASAPVILADANKSMQCPFGDYRKMALPEMISHITEPCNCREQVQDQQRHDKMQTSGGYNSLSVIESLIDKNIKSFLNKALEKWKSPRRNISFRLARKEEFNENKAKKEPLHRSPANVKKEYSSSLSSLDYQSNSSHSVTSVAETTTEKSLTEESVVVMAMPAPPDSKRKKLSVELTKLQNEKLVDWISNTAPLLSRSKSKECRNNETYVLSVKRKRVVSDTGERSRLKGKLINKTATSDSGNITNSAKDYDKVPNNYYDLLTSKFGYDWPFSNNKRRLKKYGSGDRDMSRSPIRRNAATTLWSHPRCGSRKPAGSSEVKHRSTRKPQSVPRRGRSKKRTLSTPRRTMSKRKGSRKAISPQKSPNMRNERRTKEKTARNKFERTSSSPNQAVKNNLKTFTTSGISRMARALNNIHKTDCVDVSIDPVVAPAQNQWRSFWPVTYEKSKYECPGFHELQKENCRTQDFSDNDSLLGFEGFDSCLLTPIKEESHSLLNTSSDMSKSEFEAFVDKCRTRLIGITDNIPYTQDDSCCTSKHNKINSSSSSSSFQLCTPSSENNGFLDPSESNENQRHCQALKPHESCFWQDLNNFPDESKRAARQNRDYFFSYLQCTNPFKSAFLRHELHIPSQEHHKEVKQYKNEDELLRLYAKGGSRNSNFFSPKANLTLPWQVRSYNSNMSWRKTDIDHRMLLQSATPGYARSAPEVNSHQTRCPLTSSSQTGIISTLHPILRSNDRLAYLKMLSPQTKDPTDVLSLMKSTTKLPVNECSSSSHMANRRYSAGCVDFGSSHLDFIRRNWNESANNGSDESSSGDSSENDELDMRDSDHRADFFRVGQMNGKLQNCDRQVLSNERGENDKPLRESRLGHGTHDQYFKQAHQALPDDPHYLCREHACMSYDFVHQNYQLARVSNFAARNINGSGNMFGRGMNPNDDRMSAKQEHDSDEEFTSATEDLPHYSTSCQKRPKHSRKGSQEIDDTCNHPDSMSYYMGDGPSGQFDNFEGIPKEDLLISLSPVEKDGHVIFCSHRQKNSACQRGTSEAAGQASGSMSKAGRSECEIHGPIGVAHQMEKSHVLAGRSCFGQGDILNKRIFTQWYVDEAEKGQQAQRRPTVGVAASEKCPHRELWITPSENCDSSADEEDEDDDEEDEDDEGEENEENDGKEIDDDDDEEDDDEDIEEVDDEDEDGRSKAPAQVSNENHHVLTQKTVCIDHMKEKNAQNNYQHEKPQDTNESKIMGKRISDLDLLDKRPSRARTITQAKRYATGHKPGHQQSTGDHLNKQKQTAIQDKNTYIKASGGHQQKFSLEQIKVPAIEKERVRFACDENGDWAEIGRGSYGCVYLGLLDGIVEVAIKDFYESSSWDLVIHEARMLMFLQDTGITPKFYGLRRRFDVSKQPSEYCIIMEYFGDGRTLFNVMSDKMALGGDEWMDVVGQLVAGLRLIHRKNVLINDLKADNILIDLTGGRKIIRYIDVGMATYKQGLTFQLPQDQMSKYNFLAPEVREGARTTTRSDIYSLGYMLEQMCRMADSALGGLKKLVARCMEKNPARRPDIDDIVSQVHRFIASKASVMISASSPREQFVLTNSV